MGVVRDVAEGAVSRRQSVEARLSGCLQQKLTRLLWANRAPMAGCEEGPRIGRKSKDPASERTGAQGTPGDPGSKNSGGHPQMNPPQPFSMRLSILKNQDP